MKSPHIGLLSALITFSVVPVASAEAMPTEIENTNLVAVEMMTTNVLPTVRIGNTTYTATPPTVTTVQSVSTPMMADSHRAVKTASSSQDAQMILSNHRLIQTGRAKATYKAY